MELKRIYHRNKDGLRGPPIPVPPQGDEYETEESWNYRMERYEKDKKRTEVLRSPDYTSTIVCMVEGKYPFKLLGVGEYILFDIDTARVRNAAHSYAHHKGWHIKTEKIKEDSSLKVTRLA